MSAVQGEERGCFRSARTTQRKTLARVYLVEEMPHCSCCQYQTLLFGGGPEAVLPHRKGNKEERREGTKR
jgi:hypothetical protein